MALLNSYDEVQDEEEVLIDDSISFDDPPGFVDDIPDEDLLPDVLANQPQEDYVIRNAIVVTGLPEVEPSKVEKFITFLKSKYLQKHGDLVDFFLPTAGEGKNTLGFALVCYETDAQADNAAADLQGKALDKTHSLSVFKFEQFEGLDTISEDWKPPAMTPYKDTGDLRYWLNEEGCHDQCAVIYQGGNRVSVFWHWPGDLHVIEKGDREKWTESRINWSPRGSYLATYHMKGIALWGGEKFDQINRFIHRGVQIIDFSPCERYLVTFSPLPTSLDEPYAIKIFDVVSGLLKRGFTHDTQVPWPVFKWSPNGEYFARVQALKALQVYETPSFRLLENKSIPIPDIMDFSWSPTDDIVAYWIAEKDNQPARVLLMELPSKKEIAMKVLFSVAEVRMYWHKQGNFLCVRVNRYSKKKVDADAGTKYAGMYTNFEIFRMREKNIPVDKIEITEPVACFSWEPCGSKFTLVQGTPTKGQAVVFYQVKDTAIEKLKEFEKRNNVNTVSWSPIGGICIFGGLRSASSGLEFVDTSDMTVLNTQEHFGATDIEWDPTGRYVATTVSEWFVKVDSSTHIYSSQGTLLMKLNKLEKICQFSWRPRPPCLLQEADLKAIRKNMKKYTTRFEKEDLMQSSRANRELAEKRSKMRLEFDTWRSALEQRFGEEKPRRVALRANTDTDDLENNAAGGYKEETLEFLIKVEKVAVETVG